MKYVNRAKNLIASVENIPLKLRNKSRGTNKKDSYKAIKESKYSSVSKSINTPDSKKIKSSLNYISKLKKRNIKLDSEKNKSKTRSRMKSSNIISKMPVKAKKSRPVSVAKNITKKRNVSSKKIKHIKIRNSKKKQK